MLSTRKFIKENFSKLLRSVCIPYLCILCKNKSSRSLSLCQACENHLPWYNKIHKNLLIFNNIIPLFAYLPPISDFIIAMKFRRELIYVKLLGHLLARHLQKIYEEIPQPEVIIPVPLHPSRTKERGFNQALELAKLVKKLLHIKIDSKNITRARATQMQSSLPAYKRQKNLKNAFRIEKNPYEHVLIIDDVMTTGITLLELGKTLKNHGVKKIDVACIAKTSHRIIRY